MSVAVIEFTKKGTVREEYFRSKDDAFSTYMKKVVQKGTGFALFNGTNILSKGLRLTEKIKPCIF